MPSEGVAEGIDQEFEDDDDSLGEGVRFLYYIATQCIRSRLWNEHDDFLKLRQL